MKKYGGYLVAVLATCGLLVSSAAAQVIYSDTFNRVEGSGDPNGKPADPNNFSAWGDNDNGLGGSVVNTWLVGPSRGGGANQVTDGERASTVEGGAHMVFDVTTVAPNGFTVEFNFHRFHPPTSVPSGNGFVAFGLGADTGAGLGGGLFATNNSDVAMLFQQSANGNLGNPQFFVDGALVDDGPFDYGDPDLPHDVTVSITPDVPGAYGDADTISGWVSVDGGPRYHFNVPGGAEFGNLAVSSNGFVHRSYDNLVVTAIPEPTSVVLAGMTVLAGLGWRRR